MIKTRESDCDEKDTGFKAFLFHCGWKGEGLIRDSCKEYDIHVQKAMTSSHDEMNSPYPDG